MDKIRKQIKQIRKRKGKSKRSKRRGSECTRGERGNRRCLSPHWALHFERNEVRWRTQRAVSIEQTDQELDELNKVNAKVIPT